MSQIVAIAEGHPQKVARGKKAAAEGAHIQALTNKMEAEAAAIEAKTQLEAARGRTKVIILAAGGVAVLAVALLVMRPRRAT